MSEEITKDQLELANKAQFEKDKQEAIKLYAEVFEKTGFDYIPKVEFTPLGGVVWSKELVKLK